MIQQAISDVTLAIKQVYRNVIYTTWTFSCTYNLPHAKSEILHLLMVMFWIIVPILVSSSIKNHLCFGKKSSFRFYRAFTLPVLAILFFLTAADSVVIVKVACIPLSCNWKDGLAVSLSKKCFVNSL